MCGGGVRRNAPLLGRNEVLFANTLASPSNGSGATVKVFLFFPYISASQLFHPEHRRDGVPFSMLLARLVSCPVDKLNNRSGFVLPFPFSTTGPEKLYSCYMHAPKHAFKNNFFDAKV